MSKPEWYIYLKDHAEGPLTVSQILAGLDRGKIETSHYAWKRGLPEWKPIAEIDELRDVSQVFVAKSKGVKAKPNEAELTGLMRKVDVQDDRTDLLPDAIKKAALLEGTRVEAFARQEKKKQLGKQNSRDLKSSAQVFGRLFLTILAVGFLFGIVYLTVTRDQSESLLRRFVFRFSGEFPVLTQWIDPLPHRSDWSAEQYQTLLRSLETSRPGLVVTQADRIHPQFWVSFRPKSESSGVELHVVSVPETLVGATEFSWSTQGTFKNGIAHWNPEISQPATGFFPGKYRVRVILRELGQGSESALESAIFLGGQEDLAYQEALKKYHAQLRDQVRQEWTAIQSVLAALVLQWSEVGQFAQSPLRSGSREVLVQRVEPVRQQVQDWTNFRTQLKQVFVQKFSDEVSQVVQVSAKRMSEVLAGDRVQQSEVDAMLKSLSEKQAAIVLSLSHLEEKPGVPDRN